MMCRPAAAAVVSSVMTVGAWSARGRSICPYRTLGRYRRPCDGDDVLQLREHLGGGGRVELVAPQLHPHGFAVGQVRAVKGFAQIMALGTGGKGVLAEVGWFRAGSNGSFQGRRSGAGLFEQVSAWRPNGGVQLAGWQREGAGQPG